MPTLDEAYLALIQEENSQGIARDKAVKNEVQTQGIFVVQMSHFASGADKINKSKFFFESDKSKFLSSHCGQKSHDKSTCFQLHGYPEWYEERRARRVITGF